MAKRYDILLDNNDLLFMDGDLVIGESDEQHIIDTVNAFPGWWKEYPLDGVGIMAYSKSSSALQELNRKIKIELTGDGYYLRSPIISLQPNGQLSVNPNIDAI